MWKYSLNPMAATAARPSRPPLRSHHHPPASALLGQLRNFWEAPATHAHEGRVLCLQHHWPRVLSTANASHHGHCKVDNQWHPWAQKADAVTSWISAVCSWSWPNNLGRGGVRALHWKSSSTELLSTCSTAENLGLLSNVFSIGIVQSAILFSDPKCQAQLTLSHLEVHCTVVERDIVESREQLQHRHEGLTAANCR